MEEYLFKATNLPGIYGDPKDSDIHGVQRISRHYTGNDDVM
jgi:hypothetical protein